MGAEVRRYHDFNQIVCHSEPHGIDAFDDGYSSVPDQYTNGLGPLSNSPSMVSSQRNHPEATSLHHRFVEILHLLNHTHNSSYPVSNNAFPIPPPSHNRQLIGFSANTHDPTVPVGLYGHGSFSPASSRFGTPNMTLTGFNNFPSVYHNNVNDVLVNNRHPIIYPDGLPGSFDHTVPVTADLPLPIRLTNTPRGSSTVHTPPAGVSQADLNYPAHLISDHPSQMLQENWAGHAMAPSQQDRAFNSTYQTGRLVLSRPSSALIPHQDAGVVQSSHQIRVLPTSRLSHEQAHRTSNNCIPSIALHQLGNAQGQATCLVNSYHHSPYQSNTFQAQAANGSSQAGNSTRASQHQHSHTANSTPQITGYDQAIEIHFSPGLNSSGPSGQDDGRPSGEFQLPRIPRSLALLPTLGLRPSQNGLAGVKFHEFPRIPTEIRLMIWAYSIELGGPRFTFWGYMNLPPAMAQVSMEARGVYKKGLTYWMLASGQRFTVHEPKQNMRYFGHEVPGLKLCSPGTFSPIPTQMVPSLLPIGLLSGMNILPPRKNIYTSAKKGEIRSLTLQCSWPIRRYANIDPRKCLFELDAGCHSNCPSRLPCLYLFPTWRQAQGRR
jgi:hypothetical protein